MVHPSLVLGAQSGIPYGFADVKVWNRTLEFRSKSDHQYNSVPVKEKELYKWVEFQKIPSGQSGARCRVWLLCRTRKGIFMNSLSGSPTAEPTCWSGTNKVLADKTKLIFVAMAI